MKKWYVILVVLAAIALPVFANYYTCKRCGGSGVLGTKDCSRCNGNKQILVSCPSCNGRGEVRDKYGDLQKCSRCGGSGKEFSTCPKCNGTGEEDWVCTACHGSGQVYISE